MRTLAVNGRLGRETVEVDAGESSLMVLISDTASVPPACAARAGFAHIGDVGRQLW